MQSMSARHAPGLVAAVGVFDLDHVRAEVGEDQRGRRAGHDMAELEHLELAEGEGGTLWTCHGRSVAPQGVERNAFPTRSS